MTLLKLPHELLLSISDHLDNLHSVSALARTNQQLYWHLIHYLYSLDVLQTGGSALTWAAQHGFRRTAWLSLVEGANIEAPRRVRIPLLLKHLNIHRKATWMTPLQVALCYGSDTIARFLITHGAISSVLFPIELSNCTSLHMAAAMALPSTLKILISQGLDVGTRDSLSRTPLHYAALVPHKDSVELAQVVMRLLANNADPRATDFQGSSPISMGKKRTNPVARILSKPGAVVAAYEVSMHSQDLFEDWRTSKEKHEEVAWENKRKAMQIDLRVSKSKQDRKPKKSKRRARKRKNPAQESKKVGDIVRERDKISNDTIGRADQCPAVREECAEAGTETDWSIRRRAVTEFWAKMRNDADLRSLTAARLDLTDRSECKHPHGLWKCRERMRCGSCGISGKHLSLCTDCGFVVCRRCA